MGLASTYNIDIRPLPSWPSSGNATPTPSAATKLTDGTGGDYNSFPALVSDGVKLHRCYRKGTDHNSTANGSLLYATKTAGVWSADETAVAQAAFVGLIVTDPALHILPNGDVLLLFHTVDNGTGARVNYSTIRHTGAWSAPAAFTSDFGSGQINNGGNSITDGSTVLHAVYARSGASGNRGTYLYQSTDGSTWSKRTNLHTEGWTVDQEEPSLARRSDGLALCFIRSDDDKKIRMSWSPNGTLWSVPRIVFDGWGKPHVGVNLSDDMLCITRHPVTDRAAYSYSGDSGFAWSALAYVDAQTGQMEYGSVVWLDGWQAVYAVATGDFVTDPCDLYEVTFA